MKITDGDHILHQASTLVGYNYFRAK